MRITKSTLKRLIKEELQKVLYEKHTLGGDEDSAYNTDVSHLESVMQSAMKKGYTRKLSKLPIITLPHDEPRSMKPGSTTPVLWGPGYVVRFAKFPDIILITTKGSKGTQREDWTFEDHEFRNIIGARINGAGKVYAALSR